MLKKHRFIFLGYLLFLILVAILPINSGSSALNHTFIIRIRLDYLVHAVLFIPWGLLYSLTFRTSKLSDKFTMIGAGLLMAFATEGVQYFLTYRSFNVNDLLANLLGMIVGSLVLLSNIPFLKGNLVKNNLKM